MELNIPRVELVEITKTFVGTPALNEISLKIYGGEFFTLLGPSGCGKTTTLRLIGGFIKPDHGDILLNGRSIKGKRAFDLDINTVFQSYALFPHMTVRKNVAFGLKMEGLPDKKTRVRVDEALSMVKMLDFADRYPKNLSGGEQQRVAVARAIVKNPSVLLLDEPLGSLDLKMRKQMQVELKQLQRRLGITFIYVTHDQEEALVMSDRIAVMSRGKIQQVDTSRNIYMHPQNKFVADFIGETNLIQGTVIESSENGSLILESNHKPVIAHSLSGAQVSVGAQAYLSIRPENISILNERKGLPNEFAGKVLEVIFIGHVLKVVVSLDSGHQIIGHLPPAEAVPQINSNVYISWDPMSSIALLE